MAEKSSFKWRDHVEFEWEKPRLPTLGGFITMLLVAVVGIGYEEYRTVAMRITVPDHAIVYVDQEELSPCPSEQPKCERALFRKARTYTFITERGERHDLLVDIQGVEVARIVEVNSDPYKITVQPPTTTSD